MNFPNNPTIGQQYVVGPVIYTCIELHPVPRWRSESNADKGLRTDLADVNSVVPIGGASVQLTKLTTNSLKSLSTLTVPNEKVVTVTGFYETLQVYQGDFRWDATRAEADHTGVDVIANNAIKAWAGTHTDLATLLNWSGTGVGCWVRLNTVNGLNPYWAGATGLGMSSDTLAFKKCGDVCVNKRLVMIVTAGVYLGTFDFGRGFNVVGASMRDVTFRMNTAEPVGYCVRLHGEGALALGNEFHNATIECLDPANTLHGFQIGENGFTISCSNVKVSRVEVSGFKENMVMRWCVMGNFSDIYVYSPGVLGSEGIVFESERTNQVITFTNVRSRLNAVGVRAQSGHFVTWVNCNVESNTTTGLQISTGITSGPTSWTFIGTDIEGNGTNPPAGTNAILVTQLYLDMNTSISGTKGMDITFDNCVINSPAGAYDVYAARAQNVYFKRTKFSPLVDGGFTASKLGFNTSSGAVKIYMEDCSTIQIRESLAMYAAMPALSQSGGNTYGYHYKYRVGKKQYSNYEMVAGVTEFVTSDVTGYDIRGVRSLVIDTTAGNVSVNSLLNGLESQTVVIVKSVPTNNILLVHGGGTGQILTPTAATITLTGRQGATLQFFSGNWYLV